MDGIPSWCRVGAKVVAATSDEPLPSGWLDYGYGPKDGEICTIVRAFFDPDDGTPAVFLVGYPRAHFPLCDFRPLVTRSQESDVALFLPLLRVGEPA